MQMIDELKAKIKEVFSLLPDKADEELIVQSIREDIEFKGVRIWILICAIFTASLGLNVNSTAVIIGAMLISPLMNPIVGLGLGLGIYDLTLVKRSLRSLGVMVLISLTTATLYFMLSPLSQAQSELLARTQPTIYDVLIALVGGAAGIFANSAKINKGNILMGVAIATALMPPLCTAGYGISQGSLSYFLGAAYLFTINTIFIALSTLVVVRLMQFAPVARLSQEHDRKIHRLIVAIIIGVATPSIYSGVLLVRQSIKDDSINRFVRDKLNTRDLQALKYNLIKNEGQEILDVVLLGRKLDSMEVGSLQKTMQEDYHLPSVQLLLRQDFTPENDSVHREVDRDFISADFIHKQDELLRSKQAERDSLATLLEETRKISEEGKAVERELCSLFSDVQAARLQSMNFDDDVVYMLAYKAERELNAQEQAQIRSWLSTRLSIKAEAIRFYRL